MGGIARERVSRFQKQQQKIAVKENWKKFGWNYRARSIKNKAWMFEKYVN